MGGYGASDNNLCALKHAASNDESPVITHTDVVRERGQLVVGKHEIYPSSISQALSPSPRQSADELHCGVVLCEKRRDLACATELLRRLPPAFPEPDSF